MPDYLAIDWEKEQLCGLQAEVTRQQVRVSQCFALSWPEEIDPAEQPEQAGRWLQEELRRAGITARQVLAVLPREEAAVRSLELPAASDEELPDLVRYQAAAKSSLSLDRLCLDFLPMPVSTDAAMRRVLMATVPAAKVETIRQVTSAAGLELVTLGLSPVAAAELLARAKTTADVPAAVHETESEGAGKAETSSRAADLIVCRYGNRVEIAVVRNGCVAFMHSTRLTGEDAHSTRGVLAEVSRSLVAVQKQSAGLQIASGWVVGTTGETADLIAGLAERLECPVNEIDPFAGTTVQDSVELPSDRALYAGPAGALFARSAPAAEMLDFLNPRRAVEKPDRRRLWIGLAAAAAVLLVAGMYGLRSLQLRSLEDDIDRLQTRTAELEKTLEEKQADLETAAAVRTWVDGEIDWLDRTRELAETMGTTEPHYLTSIDFRLGSGRSAGRVDARGVAQSREDVEFLYFELVERAGYDIRPHEIVRREEGGDYPYEFRLDAGL